jgi:hypothetical protein
LPWDFRELPPHRQAELSALYTLDNLRESHIHHVSKVLEDKKTKKNKNTSFF